MLQYLKKRYAFLLLFVLFFNFNTNAQDNIYLAGLRMQKSVGMYLENGFSFQFSHSKVLNNKLFFGFDYVSSRLGTAIGSNALKQDNFLLSSTWLFRNEKIIRPTARLNVGFMKVDLESDIFKDLPNSSPLLSLEFGVVFQPQIPVSFYGSFGYNLITGDGTKRPGTLYPVFFQLGIFYKL